MKAVKFCAGVEKKLMFFILFDMFNEIYFFFFPFKAVKTISMLFYGNICDAV